MYFLLFTNNGDTMDELPQPDHQGVKEPITKN